MKLALILVLLFSSYVGLAKEVVLGVGFNIPPYYLKNKDQGLEIDTIRKAFELAGHTVVFKYYPINRIYKLLDRGKIDGVTTTDQAIGLEGVYYTKKYVSYHNFAISLKSSKLKISKLSDLSNKSILAFRDAKKLLGSEYAKAISSNKEYFETSDQITQNRRLYRNMTQVSVGDKKVFLYYNKILREEGKENVGQDIIFHELFEPRSYSIALKNKALVDDFDRGLNKLKESGQLTNIINQYR